MLVRVLLADDHQLFRDALRLLLEKEATIRIVAETGNGLDVATLAQESFTNVVCMDVNLPGMNGIETTLRLTASCPDIKVIGLSSLTDPRIVLGMLEVGASGYVSKAVAGDELVRAIKTVANGQSYFCDEAAAIVMTAKFGKSNKLEENGIVNLGLGAQERQVLQLIVEGYSSSRISALLDISRCTVEVHQRNIMRKLDLHGVAALTKFAARSGITAG